MSSGGPRGLVRPIRSRMTVDVTLDRQPELPRPRRRRRTWRDYLALLKPRVMTLVVFTGLVGLIVAPGHLHPVLALTAVLCIAVGAGAAGAINMWYDRDIDAVMRADPRAGRSRAGRIDAGRGAGLRRVAGGRRRCMVMGLAVNWAAAALLASSIGFYVFVYTMWLKRRTPQNIVIGGAAGAFPPVIGWAAVTGDVGARCSMLLFADHLHLDAAAFLGAGAVRAATTTPGPACRCCRWWPARARPGGRCWSTRCCCCRSPSAPWLLGIAGLIYGIGAGAARRAVRHAARVRVLREDGAASDHRAAKRMFGYSILYLFAHLRPADRRPRRGAFLRWPPIDPDAAGRPGAATQGAACAAATWPLALGLLAWVVLFYRRSPSSR